MISPSSDSSWQEYLLTRVREWQSKSRNETDPFNRYASIFIAYNALYSLYGAMQYPGADLSRRDAELAVAVLGFVSNPKNLFQDLQPELTSYAHSIPIWREEYWTENGSRIPISSALRQALDDGQDFRTLQILMRWLYKVRCNLFHGGKDYNDRGQRRLLEDSSVLLDRIVSTLAREYSSRVDIQF